MFQIKKDFRYISYIIIGCIPISIVGLIYKDIIEQNFNNISILPITFLISSIMIFLQNSNILELTLL